MTTPVLLQRLSTIHRSLDAAGLDHAVGGAIALAVHSRNPRFTADIDLNITVDPGDPDVLLRALPPQIVQDEDGVARLRAEQQTRLFWDGTPRTPVDLFLPAHPTFHASAVERAEPVEWLDGVKALTATDLIVFKALFDRAKDWADIEDLAGQGAGDFAEAADWVESIVGHGTATVRLRGLA